MNNTDRLAILVEESYQEITASETLTDPVGKMRVSTPQSLIDTDFEYGVQSTKWETLSLMNNRPCAFYDPTQGISNVSATVTVSGTPGTYQIASITGANGRIVTITTNNITGISTSTPIYMQDTTDPAANGWFLPSNVSGNTIVYTAKSTIASSNIFDPTKTFLFIGTFYTQAAIPISASAGAAFTNVGLAVTCTTSYNHGLSVGQAIYVVGTTASSNAPNGAWVVRQTPSNNTFIFDVVFTPTGTITATAGALATLFPRTWGTSIHRAFDGGVTFSAGYPYHGNQLIRQTRRYFRYQSGKGVFFNTGSNMCSPYQVDSISVSSGVIILVTCKFPHNVGVGTTIKVAGADQSDYNGTFVVTSIPTDLTFTYNALAVPSTSIATSYNGFVVQPFKWYGAQIRVGMYTSQNGMFFQYDGQTLSVVRRSSTNQLVGYLTSLTNGTHTATGTNCKWAEQLYVGDFVVIRGMTYEIVSIEGQNQMTINPDYRGTSIASPSQVVVSKVVDTVIPQSQWNIDKMDGTGESGMNVDITKMQMWAIDYSWYGAGAIRWGFKDQRGNTRYCHRLAHGNNQTEAFMRSGNLPARYEVNTFFPKTTLLANLSASGTTMTVINTAGFPDSGTLAITASGANGSPIEYVRYTGRGGGSFTGLTRGVQDLTGPGGLTGAGGSAATAFNLVSATPSLPAGTQPVSISYWGPMSANTISHWGSAVLMDGRYDDDKSLIFVAGMTTSIANIAPGTTQPLISLRIAPSVDSGLTGILGQREILNTMQLKLVSCAAYTTGAGATFLITLRLNGQLSGGTFASAGGSSLSQVTYHTAGQTITGGENAYGFFSLTPGVNSEDLTAVRDLGNSILGGGNSFTVPSTANNKYPDGPDIVTICATNITSASTNTINARLSWTEAQA
jgi:hypothetical protein